MDEGNQVPHMEQWNFLEYSIMGLGLDRNLLMTLMKILSTSR